MEHTQKVAKANTGKKHSPERVEKNRLSHIGLTSGENNGNWQGGGVVKICKQCRKPFKISRARFNLGLGIFCSHKCHSKYFTGTNSRFWKGDKCITPLNLRIRNCNKYKKWTKDVFDKDKYACLGCEDGNRKGNFVYLQAHHIKSFSRIMKENNIKTYKQAMACKELWDINNGIALCKKCHKELHAFIRKRLKENPNTSTRTILEEFLKQSEIKHDDTNSNTGLAIILST